MASRRALARWLIWFASLSLLCGLAWLRAGSGPLIQTNILNLLPGRQDSGALKAATARSRASFTNQFLALVTGPDTAKTRTAAMAAYQALVDSGLESTKTNRKLNGALQLYNRHHFALLTPRQIERLAKGGAQALATDVAVSLASPAGLVRFGADPGGYLAKFVSALPRPYPDFLPDGPLWSAKRGHERVFFMRMALGSNAFGQQGATTAATAVEAAEHAVAQRCGVCRFEATGAALFADAARHEGKLETIWLTSVSTLLIMVLIAFVFRSLAPHGLGFLQLFSSIAAAGAAVIAIFGSINILTLVFGTTLLGIAIDYAFLYFSEYWFGTSAPPGVMGKIRNGLVVGLITGVLAFAFLLLAGFPALAQIAVFSVAGLLEAAVVVALIFPVVLTRPANVALHPAVIWPARFIARACQPTPWRYALPILVLILAIPGWFRLQARDDVTALTHYPPQLMHTDSHIRSTLGRFPASGFFLIQGNSLDQALQRETRLFNRIASELPHADPMGLSRFLPSSMQQRRSLDTWQSVLDDPGVLRKAFIALGLPARLAEHIEKEWNAASGEPIDPTQLFGVVPDLKRFIIPSDKGVALLATVFGDQDIDSDLLARAAAKAPGARFVLPLNRIANTFEQVRIRASWLVVIGYLLISAILVWRYGYREAVRMLIPPLLALGITMGALGWLGEPVNVFTVVALILILGLGRDYTVFLREVGPHERSPALSVTCSALTTLLSFGLLSLSRIPALHAFGLATLIGILASYLLAPLSLPTHKGDPE